MGGGGGGNFFFASFKDLTAERRVLYEKTHNVTNATDSHNYPCGDWHALHCCNALLHCIVPPLVKLGFFAFFLHLFQSETESTTVSSIAFLGTACLHPRLPCQCVGV